MLLLTQIAGLTLRRLGDGDAGNLFQLIQRNRRHLTTHGDYAEVVAASLETLAAELSGSDDQVRLGIFLGDRLVGRIDVIPVNPPSYGLGYWLCQSETGKGYGSVAVKTALMFARDDLGATNIYAGVTHGNHRSVALLRRNGFVAVADFERYTRYHRALGN
jgi:RimJ/RimL family protein N-acetyltransferase